MPKKVYTKEDITFVRKNYPHMSIKDLMLHFSKPESAILALLHRYHITKSIWTEEMDRYLIDNYSKERAKQIAIRFNVKPSQVYSRVYKLGLRKICTNLFI